MNGILMGRLIIQSGGQTGVDRAALDFAKSQGISYRGWCPKGGWAEDYPLPPGLLNAYPQLEETPSHEPEQRTAWNVRDSRATLILLRGDPIERSPGTVFARQMAQLVFRRPCRIADITSAAELTTAATWLRETIDRLPIAEVSLNIAGLRESENPGIYAASLEILPTLLDALVEE
jgi:hypothetical protein